MARPTKYNWEAIRKSYEDGFTVFGYNNETYPFLG